MRVFLLATCAVSLVLPTRLHAGGINLSWSDCGSAGQMFRAFACNTNDGDHRMVASFDPPETMPDVIGALGIVDLCTGGIPLPPWWTYVNPGSCRPAGLFASAVLGGATNCTDHWRGQAFATIGAYQVGFDGWDSARIIASVWTTQFTPEPVEAGTEYHAFTLVVRNTATVGDGVCGGCSLPACIVLNEIQLLGQTGGAVMTSPRDFNYLQWQGRIYDCPFIVATHTRTWGQIKSLYR